MKWNSWKAGEEQILAAYNMMDFDNDGYVSNEWLLTIPVTMH